MKTTKKKLRLWYWRNRQHVLNQKKLQRQLNPEENRKRAKAYYLSNREKIKAYRSSERYKRKCRVWRQTRKEKVRDSRLRFHYGISSSDYDRMFSEQGGVCAICKNGNTRMTKWGDPEKHLLVDHCNETKKVRGLLCHRCNVALGLLKHDPKRLISAAEYLKQPVR